VDVAKSVNKVLLLGNIGKDPEVKFLPSGQAVANFSIATTERYKDKAGEWQDRSEWHNLVAYGKLAEIIRDHVHKGSKVFIEGRLTTRSWDDKDSGRKIYRTEIVVGEITLLGDGQKQEKSESKGPGGYEWPESSSSRPVEDSTYIDDSEIPF
jgi:single-strand DNA-binding protein